MGCCYALLKWKGYSRKYSGQTLLCLSNPKLAPEASLKEGSHGPYAPHGLWLMRLTVCRRVVPNNRDITSQGLMRKDLGSVRYNKNQTSLCQVMEPLARTWCGQCASSIHSHETFRNHVRAPTMRTSKSCKGPNTECSSQGSSPHPRNSGGAPTETIPILVR